MFPTSKLYHHFVVFLVLSITGMAIFLLSNQLPNQATIRRHLGLTNESAVNRADDMTRKSADFRVTMKTTTFKFIASTFKTRVGLKTFQDVRNSSKAPASITTKLTPKEDSKNESDVRKSVLHSSASSSAALDQMTPSVIKPVYLCVYFQGRLGNLMFEFASLLGIARLHGMTPAIPKDNELLNVFNINVSALEWEVASGFNRVSDKRHCAFDPIVANFRSNLTMHGFFQSWRYFSNVYSELRKQLTFKEEIVKRARLALETSIQSQHPYLSLRNTTFVGIHVRRGDMLQPDKISFGYAVGSKDYLFRAMGYFLSKYESVMFIVCSYDMEWSRKIIPSENATFILGQEAEVDMATLSLCNHTIMTVGSYGWWSGWLAGGTTIYQIQQVIPDTTLDKRFNLTDYMLPDWIGMNETSVTRMD